MRSPTGCNPAGFLCDPYGIIEIKYSRIRYEMTKDEREKIEHRVSRFINESKTKKGVQTVLITTLGCEQNRNADVCQRFLTLEDLFS